MAARHQDEQRDVAEAARLRLERDWRLPMHERLARMQKLCKQATSIAGVARRR